MKKPEIVHLLFEHLYMSTGPTAEHFVDTAKLADDLKADSFDQIVLVMSFEEKCQIEISDDDMYKHFAPGSTIADVVAYIEKRTA